jgi:hypothetical protein
MLLLPAMGAFGVRTSTEPGAQNVRIHRSRGRAEAPRARDFQAAVRTFLVHRAFLAKKMGSRETREPLVSLESGRQDSNLRPSAPKAPALPSCATPRHRCTLAGRCADSLSLLLSPLVPREMVHRGAPFHERPSPYRGAAVTRERWCPTARCSGNGRTCRGSCRRIGCW